MKRNYFSHPLGCESVFCFFSIVKLMMIKLHRPMYKVSLFMRLRQKKEPKMRLCCEMHYVRAVAHSYINCSRTHNGLSFQMWVWKVYVCAVRQGTARNMCDVWHSCHYDQQPQSQRSASTGNNEQIWLISFRFLSYAFWLSQRNGHSTENGAEWQQIKKIALISIYYHWRSHFRR